MAALLVTNLLETMFAFVWHLEFGLGVLPSAWVSASPLFRKKKTTTTTTHKKKHKRYIFIKLTSVK